MNLNKPKLVVVTNENRDNEIARLIRQNCVPMTEEEYRELNDEIEKKIIEKKAVIAEKGELAKDSAGGIGADNAGYEQSQSAEISLGQQIWLLKYDLNRAVIIKEELVDNTVGIGSTFDFTVRDGKKEETMTYKLGIYSSSIPGHMSIMSPVGKAVAGSKLDQEVQPDINGYRYSAFITGIDNSKSTINKEAETANDLQLCKRMLN